MEYNKENTRRRPKEVSDEHFTSEWDRIFGKKKENKEEVEVEKGDELVLTGEKAL